MSAYLTAEEKDFVASHTETYPASNAYNFASTRLKGKLVEDEVTICRLIQGNKNWAKKASPEVVLALKRNELSPKGIQFALSNLMRFSNSIGRNYLDLLEIDPLQIAEILRVN
jgi:hypothetical protein